MLNFNFTGNTFYIYFRYSTFIILYPIGVTGELLCLYFAQKEAGDTGYLSIFMPNMWNVIFRYNYFLILIMSLYIPRKYYHRFN